MPSSTFINLPQEKKERLMQKFYEEFSQGTYQEASISKIVSDLQIAKGSIYKYFKNKQDLYYYLIECASDKKLQYIERELKSYDPGTMDLLWAIIQTGSRFDIENPLITRFLNRVATDTHDGFDRDIRKDLMKQSSDFIRGFVLKGQADGEIRTDIDAATLTHYINLVLAGTGSMLAAKHGLALDDYLDQARSEFTETSEPPLMQELHAVYTLLNTGIKKQT